jgi:hypothetical protein
MHCSIEGENTAETGTATSEIFNTTHTNSSAILMMWLVETNENTSGKYFDHNSQMTLCKRIVTFKEDTQNIKYDSQDRLCTEQMLQTERNFQ